MWLSSRCRCAAVWGVVLNLNLEREVTMKRIAVSFLVFFFLGSISLWAAEEGNLFQSLGCSTCHKEAAKSESFPSLSEITQAYGGKADQLVNYLNGDAGPILKPESGATMKRYVEKTKALSDADRKALADFIMNQSK
jgi:cytochrome c551/c552